MSTRTIPEIIDAYGGASAFSRVIGVKASTASEMKRRAANGGGLVHPRHWPAIIATVPGDGVPVTYDELVLAHAYGAKAAA